jgi:hypothetical protein
VVYSEETLMSKLLISFILAASALVVTAIAAGADTIGSCC